MQTFLYYVAMNIQNLSAWVYQMEFVLKCSVSQNNSQVTTATPLRDYLPTDSMDFYFCSSFPWPSLTYDVLTSQLTTIQIM